MNEQITSHIASRLQGLVIIETHCGQGCQTIQFGKFTSLTIAIEEDP